MMMFCLSAIHPDKMRTAVSNVARVMAPGAVLWFRDYAERDHAQIKFARENRIGKNFYARADGTRSYFFTIPETDALMRACGLEPVGDTRLIERVIENRKSGAQMHRAWVHGRFRRVASSRAADSQ